jgi:Pyruvate/2-oxoacid:ferredoxin oxidoreductase delta subunit
VGVIGTGRATLVAVTDRCQGCGACLLTCPEHAIRPDGGTLRVLASRCTGCGECVEVCPVDAISYRKERR